MAFRSSCRFSNVELPALGRNAAFGACHCFPIFLLGCLAGVGERVVFLGVRTILSHALRLDVNESRSFCRHFQSLGDQI